MNPTTLEVGGDASTWGVFLAFTAIMLLATGGVVGPLVREAARRSREPGAGRPTRWFLRGLPPTLVIVMAALPYVSLLVHEPARAVTFDGRGVILHYLWSREAVPYSEIRSVRYEVAPYRRGSRVHEVAVSTTAGRTYSVRAKSYDPDAVRAVKAVYAEFASRLPHDRLESSVTAR